jgi:8-hydroxy-5-deazaflavin:NADPH oxidoreductase
MDAKTPTGTIGIIGAGRLGQALARTAQRAGRKVVIATDRAPESLSSLVAALGEGVSAGTRSEAAASGIVAIAVPWTSVPAAVAGVSWSDRIVLDATNALRFPDLKPAELNGRTSSEIVAELVEGARVVKAANTRGAEVLGGDPHAAGGRRVVFLSGDDGRAKTQVAGLFEDAGFSSIDLGGLATGGRMLQAPDGALFGRDVVQVP